MKVSDVSLSIIKDSIGFSGNELDALLTAYSDAAKSYVIGYTGMTEDELDEHEDITFAYMALVDDMYIHRYATAEQSAHENPTVKQILAMYAKNYV